MLVPGIQLLLQPGKRRRWVGLLLFLTVFFLPLHFHVIATASQLTKECSCLHGNRMQMAAAAAPSNLVAIFAAQPVVMMRLQVIGHGFTVRSSTRAPPHQVSL
jgi:hypothetical protein